MCLIVLALSYRALSGPSPIRIETVQCWIEPLSNMRFDRTGFTALAKVRLDFSGAHWTDVALPYVMPAPSWADTDENVPVARLWLRATYSPPPDAASDQRVAFHVTRVMGGAYEVWIDGKLVEVNADNWRMQWNTPIFATLPDDAVANKQPIEFEIAVPFRLSQGFAVGSMYIGPAEAIQQLHDKRVFFQSTVPHATILVTLLLGFLALHFWYLERSDRAHLMLALSAFAWFVTNSQYFGDFSDDVTSAWFNVLNDSGTSWLFCFLALFAMQFDEIQRPRLERILILYPVMVTLATLPVWKWNVQGLVIQHYFDLIFVFAVFGYLTWVSASRGNRDYRTIMAAIWSQPLMGLHTLYYLTGQRAPDGIHLYPYSAFIVFGAFLYVIQRRYIHARQALVYVNASLDCRLRDRERELQLQHEQLLASEQQRVLHDERQRLMRDMHDGVGTALMTSLALAEHGQLDQQRAASVLRETLDELKLVIDSLEPTNHDLVFLLASLRFRFGPRLEDSGLKLHWRMEELPPLHWLDPSSALQVLRIVQETLSNILKHAKATEVSISTSPASADDGHPGALIKITDNGRGFDPATIESGRGLSNLRHRALQLGGQLCVQSLQGTGTTVSLYLPEDAESHPHG